MGVRRGFFNRVRSCRAFAQVPDLWSDQMRRPATIFPRVRQLLLVCVGALGCGGGARAAMICAAPFGPDTGPTTAVVGTGTAGSCSEAALTKALARGGVIRFNCGGAATIAITSQKILRTDVNTTIDGQGLITLDGGGTTRLL